MRNGRVRATVFSAMLFGSAAACALEPAEESPVGKAVCGAGEWRRIEAALAERSQGHHADELKDIAYSYFCGKGAGAKTRLMGASPRLVRTVVGDIEGSSGSLTLASEAILPREGRAWDASVFVVGTDLTVEYRPDVSCNGAIKFRPVASGWLIVEVSEACC